MTTIPSNSESTIRTSFPMSGERIKGGEKRMASEWEELEKLSKEELIIELVKERTAHRDFMTCFQRLMYEYPIDRVPPYVVESDEDEMLHEGQRTTDEWARRIALYAKARSADPEFGYTDMFDYGINHDQAYEVFDELAEEKVLDWDSADPRSSRFSGIPGRYADEIAEMDPEERSRLKKEWQEHSDDYQAQ